MAVKKNPFQGRKPAHDNPGYVRVVEAFATDPKVSCGEGKGFGSGEVERSILATADS